MSIDRVEQGLTASANYLSQLDQLIKSQILGSWPDVIPGIDPIARGLDSIVAQAASTLRSAETELRTQIDPLVRNAIPNALDVVGNLTRVLNDNLQQLLANIASAEDVLGVAINTIKNHSPQLARWVYDNVAGSFGNVALGVLKEMEGQEAAGINAVLDTVLAMPNQPEWFTTLTQGFRNRGAEWQALALPALLVGAILGAVSALEEPFRLAIQQGALEKTPVREAEHPQLITAMMRGFINDERYRHGMRQNGFQDDISLWMLRNAQPLLEPELITRLYMRGQVPQAEWETEIVKRGFSPEQAIRTFQASQLLLPEDAIRNAFLRDIYTTEQHDAALGQYGYTQDRAELLRQLYFYIPGPQDLIHFGIRNVFNPEIVQRFTLDEDKPDAFVKAAAQQGISADWAGKYWQAHWIMPGREAFFEMFQRTIDNPLDEHADKITLSDGTIVYNIMGRNTLNLALRDVDTPPFYRDKLTEIAYHPLTRIDIRRLANLGLLTHSQVERAYLDLGYNQVRARQLADFTDQLTARARKDETAQLTDGLRRQILRFYVAHKLDVATAKTALKEIGATEAEITVWLAESDVLREAELAAAVEGGIGKLYVAKMITDTEAIQRLHDAGVPVEAQNLLFRKWDLEIEFRGGSAHIHAHKELTKAEVLEALIDGLIDSPTAETMLEDLGYEKTSADAEVSLARYRAAKATKTAQVDAVKAGFINGTIETLEASNRLDALHIPSEKRDADLAIWTLQRETRTERIPIATLRDMAKAGLVTETEVLAHLKRHRFTDADAALMWRFWNNAPRPQARQRVSGTGSTAPSSGG